MAIVDHQREDLLNFQRMLSVTKWEKRRLNTGDFAVIAVFEVLAERSSVRARRAGSHDSGTDIHVVDCDTGGLKG